MYLFPKHICKTILLSWDVFILFHYKYAIIKKKIEGFTMDNLHHIHSICPTSFILSVMSVQSQLCLTLCNPMDCSTPGLPVHQQLLKFTQTHVHRVGDAIQPSHPLSFPSPASVFPSIRVFQMSQFFASGGQSIGVSASTSVLPMNIQDWFPLEWTGWISLLSKGLSRVFSNTTLQKHQLFGAQLSLWSNSHIDTWLLEKP